MPGRVISAKNENKLRQALTALNDVLSALGEPESDSREVRNAAAVYEHRSFDMVGVEVRADDKRTIGGYAAVFERKSVMLYGFREKIQPGAFVDSLQDDVRALWQHDTSQVLGRTRSGTLRLWEDETGLGFELEPPDTQTGRDAVTLIGRGDVDQMSFGFTVPIDGDEWSDDEDGIPLRTIKRAKLIEVSPVTFPAYQDTSVDIVREAPEWVQRALAQGVDHRVEPDIQRALREMAYRTRYLEIMGG
jgi:HK97 family phage prohead protease